MDDKPQQIFDLANSHMEARGQNQDDLIQLGLEKKIKLSYEDIHNIQKKNSNFSQGITPKIVSEFLKKVITTEINVLVPWNIYGELVDGISSYVKDSVLISNNDKWANITKMMLKDAKHQNIIGDPLIALDELKETVFDLICSFPPMGMRAKTEINTQLIRAELAHLLILKSSYQLSESGQMFFVVHQNFFNRKVKNAVLPILEDNGVYLDSAFYLPPGTLINTGIGTYLVVLSHKKYEELFVSELKKENLEQVILNWNNRKESKILQNGKLVEHELFTSYERLEKEIEVKKIVRRANLAEEPLKNIATIINSLPRKNETFKELANSVYLPNIGLSDAVDNQDDMKNTPQNYFQIVLNDSVNSAYLAKWFNTELGILLRESLMSGNHIRKINKSNIENANVYLPEKNVRQEILNIQLKVDDFRNELLSIESRAWNYPNSYELLTKRLEKLNREDGFVDWMETLPFPLASILYKYYAKTDAASKKDFLLHFFEAFAQFQVVLMMSAYAKNDRNLDKKYIHKIKPDDLTRATFGTWVYTGENMAKKLRQLLNDSSEQCLRLFQHKRKSLIEIISSKELYKILNRTKDYRNDWMGHGGAESDVEARNRLALLEKELHLLRKVIGDVYEGYQLIQPGTGHFSFGLFHCNCMLLTGTRNTFIEKSIEVSNGLDIENLYLIEEDGYNPLEILPFIKLMPSPNTQVNACYFYNRLAKDGVRMVSYYFDQDADVTIQNIKIETLINNLNIN